MEFSTGGIVREPEAVMRCGSVAGCNRPNDGDRLSRQYQSVHGLPGCPMRLPQSCISGTIPRTNDANPCIYRDHHFRICPA